ncbi:MAG: bifunctional (p)ppGpp synthetase/guanosine-3',5'-bis(diphosphate) 3'-pyrophosphohydrolase [Lachnospiraceae bacterium]|nr:bifunctional (p)ppGpp synthetase/guanosine-3',5'-bis(diphosphate) 3'-pyrophosphohydrolase [Lachnospiraceae bacterium]
MAYEESHQNGVKTIMDQVSNLYQVLVETIRKYRPQADLSGVDKAYRVSVEAHKDQLRQSGEPYVIHPLHVAIILAQLELDLETIIAGLLHDCAEDTDCSVEDIRREFGQEVAELVDGVTKLKQLTYINEDAQSLQAENYRKMFLAMAKDIRVILIKLADRLHNMRTLEYKSPEKQKEKARETIDIYSPLAERLGISRIKVELDDLCLKYLEPEVYADLARQVGTKLSQRENYISEIVREISDKLKESGIEASVYGRPKHFFSIYKKMMTKDKTLDQIYDLLAVRVLVDNVRDCYGSLGVIHDMFTPMPGRFKDYIAMPKSNMYQSLHSTLMGPGGSPFEVQIRTREMHRTAEFGIAAHWKYKEGKTGPNDTSEQEKLKWLEKILEWQKDLDDNNEFISTLKDDLNIFRESVYVFTPGGEVITLPAGSTIVDFAYAIHSAVGNRMVGARVNGRIVTIDYELKNGEQVEIMTSQNSKGPSADWLKIARTNQAKNKINQWFKKEQKAENVLKGKESCERYIKQKGLPEPHELLQPEWMGIVCRKYGFRDWDAIMAAVGFGALKEGQVINRLYEEYKKKERSEITQEQFIEKIQQRTSQQNDNKTARERKGHSTIMVKGLSDVAVRFSHCCNPVPGDEIVGYITRGRGVSLHRTDCVNVLNMPADERARLVDAEWGAEAEGGGTFISTLEIRSSDKKGQLMEITGVITHMDINIHFLSVRRTRNNIENVFLMSVEIVSKEQLKLLVDKLRQVPGVYEVNRA